VLDSKTDAVAPSAGCPPVSFDWVYPYLAAYTKLNGVEFVDALPKGDSDEGLDALPRRTVEDLFGVKEDEIALAMREWVDLHVRTLLRVMGPPFDAALSDTAGTSSRYLVLAAASDAVDEMVNLIGRMTQDGRRLVFAHEIPELAVAIDRAASDQVQAVSQWLEGSADVVSPLTV
jgi:hypothetical protein